MQVIYSLKLFPFIIFFTLILVFISCNSPSNQSEAKEAESEEIASPASFRDFGNLLTLTTDQMDIQLSDTIISSGLTTVRYTNNSTMTHFIRFEKMPEVDGVQKTANDIVTEVGPAFDEGMDLINEGKAAEGFEAFGKIPSWFGQMEYVGGIGLIGPESTSQATFNLPHGTYALECYIKSNGVFHSSQGMVVGLVVDEASNELTTSLPETPVVIHVNEDGYILQGSPTAGLQTFRVNFNTSKVHENFAMADVNIVRLEPETNPNEVQVWMNWANPEGFGTPCPATFVGGIQEMATGNSGTFTVRLEPGDYALIAEVPESNQKGLYKKFTVPPPN